MFRSWRSTIVCLSFAVLGIAIPAKSSLAATCSGYGCDGKDATPTGCAVGAYTAVTAPIRGFDGKQIGLVELRASNSCGTNWARATSYDGPKNITVRVESQDGRAVGGTVPNTTQAYSFMLYGPTTPARACGYFVPEFIPSNGGAAAYSGPVYGACTNYY